MTIKSKRKNTSHIDIVMASPTCARRIKRKKPDKLFSHAFRQIHERNKRNVNMIQQKIVLRLFNLHETARTLQLSRALMKHKSC